MLPPLEGKGGTPYKSGSRGRSPSRLRELKAAARRGSPYADAWTGMDGGDVTVLER
jgi:hypothetical protein